MRKLFILASIVFSLQAYSFSVEEGKEALMPFKKELMGTLMSTMKKSGPVAALETCHMKAMPITQKYAQHFIGMGRTSHKIRNPKNKPQAWVKPYLKEFVSGKRKEALTVKLKNGHTGYLEPIYVQAKCLVCHGKRIAKPIAQALEEKYPQDQARGFKVGDFRGLFWLEVAK